MTPEQALANLDSAVAQMTLNRAQHSTLMQSITVLSAAIKPKEKSPEPPKLAKK